MIAGEETVTPKPRRLGPRTLAAAGMLLALVVGGVVVAVLRTGTPPPSGSVAREDPARSKEPRFLETQPETGDRWSASIEARQREQERRREELRDLLEARVPPAPAEASPAYPRSGDPLPPALPVRSAAEPSEEEPPPGVYRPYPSRSPRPLEPVPARESRSASALERALAAPILLGAPRDRPEEPAAPGQRPRFPLTPPAPPDLRSFLAQLPPSGGTPLPQEAPSAPQVDFGRVVWAPALLLTALSSESPGPAEAWIEADAKDRQGRVVLPQGSRVFGSYETALGLGQRRLVVRWTSIDLPDGSTVALDGARGAGRDGSGGLPGHVDARIWGVFGRALLLSAVGAASQLGQPQESATFGAPASNRQIAAASVANELARAAADVVRQATEIRPIIRVPAGMQFHVFVPADFELR